MFFKVVILVLLSTLLLINLVFFKGPTLIAHSQPCRAPGAVRFGLQAPCSQLRVVPGKLLYLVMGEGAPKAEWISRSNWPNITLLYVAWKSDIRQSIANISSLRMRAFYFPNSTWTTGRNYQIQLAFDMEREQQWKFEYYIFWDEDAYLSYRVLTRPEIVIKNNSDEGFRLFNRLLIQDRPMRAGITFNTPAALAHTWNWTRRNFGCVRRCQIDNAVVAYHRTAVDLLLPYSGRYDNVSWWVSAFMANIMSAVLAPERCSFYREVLVEADHQIHGHYPRGRGEGATELYNGMAFVNQCLAKHGYAGYNASTPFSLLSYQIGELLGPQPEERESNCTTHSLGVDFGALLSSRLEHWPVTCL